MNELAVVYERIRPIRICVKCGVSKPLSYFTYIVSRKERKLKEKKMALSLACYDCYLTCNNSAERIRKLKKPRTRKVENFAESVKTLNGRYLHSKVSGDKGLQILLKKVPPENKKLRELIFNSKKIHILFSRLKTKFYNAIKESLTKEREDKGYTKVCGSCGVKRSFKQYTCRFSKEYPESLNGQPKFYLLAAGICNYCKKLEKELNLKE